ncbi:MAG: hypothetical protein ABIL58_21425 [Pseudomonadota bacterium]
MKYLSYRFIAACILLPPLLYILTIYGIERYCYYRIAGAVTRIVPGDMGALLNGTVRLSDAVSANLTRFLSETPYREWGARIDVTVLTRTGKLIYPQPVEGRPTPLTQNDPLTTASINFGLLQEGLVTRIDVNLDPGSWFSTIVLCLDVIVFLLLFGWHYRRSLRRLRIEDCRREEETRRLQGLLSFFSKDLSVLADERRRLEETLQAAEQRFQSERHRASENEHAWVAEIESLERQLAENQARQADQKTVIDSLGERLKKMETPVKRKENAHRRQLALIERRFRTLYKNIDLHERALDGLQALNDDLQLKAEELIHQLDADSGRVVIKRKVFTKNKKETVFEVAFGNHGRVYFRAGDGRRLDVVTIGTKHTQRKDLEYIERL